MRYLGCKINLLTPIEAVVREAGCSEGVFCDLFAGTHAVAAHFKRQGFQIISNDLLFVPYVFGRALIQNNTLPHFARLIPRLPTMRVYPAGDPYRHVLTYLNRLEGDPDGFIFHAYCPGGHQHPRRRYFSDANGQRIDRIRQTIEAWWEDRLITEDEYYLLLLCLLEAVSKVANISGTYGAFLKGWDRRARKPLRLNPIPPILSDKPHQVYRMDANDLIHAIECDVLYIDPPYNARQYVTNYHLLETIARYDAPKIYGKTGLRPYSEIEKSRYCSRTACLEAFTELIQNARAGHIVVSYNSEGIMSAEEILDVLNQRGKARQLPPIDYRRFKSHSKTSTRSYVQEYLFHVRT